MPLQLVSVEFCNPVPQLLLKFLLVPAQRDTFIEAAVNLALKLAYVPVALETFYLIEFAGILVFDPHKYQVMRPIQHKFWSPGRLV